MSFDTPQSSAPEPVRDREPARRGTHSLVLALTALLGATIAAVVFGATIGPMEASHGRTFADTPEGYQALVYGLGASVILWTVLGIAAIVLGILSLNREAAKGRAIWGIVLAVLAPVVALVAALILMIATALTM